MWGVKLRLKAFWWWVTFEGPDRYSLFDQESTFMVLTPFQNKRDGAPLQRSRLVFKISPTFYSIKIGCFYWSGAFYDRRHILITTFVFLREFLSIPTFISFAYLFFDRTYHFRTHPLKRSRKIKNSPTPTLKSSKPTSQPLFNQNQKQSRKNTPNPSPLILF